MDTSRKKIEILDTLLIIVSIICFSGSGYWLYRDMYKTETIAENAIQIGKISEFTKTVKRKYGNSLVWYPAKSEGKVFEGDWIFTGTQSEATISFLDGGSLVVSPESMIVLNTNKGNLNIELTHGSLLANLETQATIQIGKRGHQETIKSSKGSIQISNNKEITVLAGSASVSGKKLIKNEQIDLSEGVVKKQSQAAKLIFPGNDNSIRTNERRKISFRWSSKVKSPTFIELSRQKDFQNPLVTKTSKTPTALTLQETGKYFWRVRIDEKGKKPLFSEINMFYVKHQTLPELIEPLALASLTAEEFPAAVDFGWDDPSGSWTHFDFQVSRDETFASTLEEKNALLTATYQVMIPEEGQYHWRVRGNDLESKTVSKWTPTRPFSMGLKRLEPASPLVLKNQKILYPLGEKLLPQVTSNNVLPLKKAAKPLMVQWENDDSASGYLVTLSDQSNLKTPKAQIEVKEPSLQLESAYPGTTHFGIKALFDRERESPTTKGKIISLFPSPKNLEVKNVADKLEMHWQEEESPFGYEVRLKSTKSSAKKTLYVDIASAVVPENMEAFSWKVRRVRRGNKSAVSSFSKENIYAPKKTVLKKPASVEPERPGPYPKFTQPSNQKTFVVMEGGQAYIPFRWKYETKAKSYEFEVARTESMSQILFSKSIAKKRKYIMKKSLPEGIYYFRVRAVDGETPSEWSDVLQFRISNAK